MPKQVLSYRVMIALVVAAISTAPTVVAQQSQQAQPLRDPTMPMAWRSQQQVSQLDADAGLHLTRIRFGEDSQSAVIHGNTVAAGDKIGNYRVVKILPNQVELMSSTGERVQLQLFKSLKQVINEGSQ